MLGLTHLKYFQGGSTAGYTGKTEDFKSISSIKTFVVVETAVNAIFLQITAMFANLSVEGMTNFLPSTNLGWWKGAVYFVLQRNKDRGQIYVYKLRRNANE
ncbi:hypothetical protein HUJ04_010095 [Dendroctonus ponderosae]|nr:hypothetical protein HUJ04_010095 [Dendroctonus ponderosae]